MKLIFDSVRLVRGAARIGIAAALIGASAAALATNYNEGPITSGTYVDPAGAGHGQNGTCVDTACTSYATASDLSSNGASPTNIGALTPGDNFITGSLTTYGSTFLADGVTPVGPNGERTNQDMDYATFTVPFGYVLANFLVGSGTNISILPRADRLFLGLASGSSITDVPYGPTANSAAGLLGFTLVSQAQLGTDILPAIGSANPSNFPSIPGATTFRGSLGAGTYTLWLYDGDNAATYSFDAVVAAVPEPAAWMMMIAGFGIAGAGLRRRRMVRTSQLLLA